MPRHPSLAPSARRRGSGLSTPPALAPTRGGGVISFLSAPPPSLQMRDGGVFGSFLCRHPPPSLQTRDGGVLGCRHPPPSLQTRVGGVSHPFCLSTMACHITTPLLAPNARWGGSRSLACGASPRPRFKRESAGFLILFLLSTMACHVTTPLLAPNARWGFSLPCLWCQPPPSLQMRVGGGSHSFLC